MKAVLLNSANKNKDDGTRTVNGIPVPPGGFWGMDRAVVKTNGNADWLQSDAYLDNTEDGLIPNDTFAPYTTQLPGGDAFPSTPNHFSRPLTFGSLPYVCHRTIERFSRRTPSYKNSGQIASLTNRPSCVSRS
jgi:hypothetical protein